MGTGMASAPCRPRVPVANVGTLLLTTGLAMPFAPAPRIVARVLVPLASLLAVPRGAAAQRFEVTIAPSAHAAPVTGRLVIAVARRASPEPRLTIAPQGPALFAIDLDGQRPGTAAVVDGTALGYPFALGALPPGDYFAQAVVNVYERATRADGHTLWVRLNDGRQEFFSNAAGNLHSEVRPVRVGRDSVIRITVDQVLAASPRPADTEWVKRISIRSDRLSRFWGRPIHIHATVLVPRGFDDDSAVRYPAVYTFGHNVPFGFNPDSTRARGRGEVSPVTGVESGYDFAQAWTSDSFPRMVAISLEQQTPYFPDSYSVNSANNGPYGDALLHEVIPELERRFRLIAKPYARLVEGASTGGWQSLALQLFHPDVFGGAWVLQPDPIDFRNHQLVNIYEDTSAFNMPAGQFVTAERPFRRSVEGQPVWSVRQLSLFEEVLGTRGRGGYQLGAWEAVFGPTDADGYPRPLWNKLTGTIDREVATYWREHGFDLRDYAQRHWPTLGPKLAGKLHLASGDMDDFYLNLAVYRFEDFLKATANPRSDAAFAYGRPKKGHSWHEVTWAALVRRMAEHVARHAPPGDDTGTWRR